ncbi:MAG: hypothetical protein ACYC2G_09965 [Gemmatimonadaceae bacterium]
MRTSLVSLAAVLAVLAPALAVAQQPAGQPGTRSQAPPPTPEIDVAEPMVAPPSARLASGSWSYRILLSRGGQTIELARRTLTVGPAPSDASAWLLVDQTGARGQVTADSLFLSRVGLTPRRRAATMGPVRIALTFDADSVRGMMSAPGGESLAVSLPAVPGLVASGAMLESLFTVMPLAEGWAATAVQVAPSPTGTVLAPATFRVMAADSVTVPAGTFAVWKLVVTAGGAEQWLWLDRSSGRLVRSQMSPPLAPDVTYVTELVEAAPAP